MITRAEVEKLGALHAVEPTMLSLYLAVPPSADPSVLSARAGELVAPAEAASGQAAEPRAMAPTAPQWRTDRGLQ